MTLHFSDGTSKSISALIDTGAEVNIVRRDLVDPSHFRRTKYPIRLGTANSTRLSGGDHDITVVLGMNGTEVDSKRAVDHRIPCRAYDAAISHDMIISYKWLAENNVILCPSQHGLLFKGRQGAACVWVAGIPSPPRTNHIITLRVEDVADGADVLEIELTAHDLGKWRLHPRNKASDRPMGSTPAGCHGCAVETLPAELDDPDDDSDDGWDCEDLSGEELDELAMYLLEIEAEVGYIKGFVGSRDPITGPSVEDRRKAILHDFASTVFAGKTGGDPPIRGPLGEAEVQLKPGARPVKQRAYAITGERRAAWEKLINQLLEDGKIEPGYGPWSSPSFPVPKKLPGTWRLVVDFRALNEATETDAHPLPRIEEVLQRQGRFRIWSLVDMKDGYHQIPLKKEHRNLTCMSTPRGTMRWKVLVMGLKNGNAIFQRVMEDVLRDEECADPYVDDIIIGSTGDTEEELLTNHERDLRRVLGRLEKAQLVAEPGKARLFMREIEFCGHVLREGTRTPAPGKLACIQKWTAPKTITQLRGFLGLANYYSHYVPGYASLAAPLMDLLKVDKTLGKKGSKVALNWTPKLERQFTDLKAALATELSLFHVFPDQPFRMRTDASAVAVGGVLEQERSGVWVPVSFYSKKLSRSQQNWSTREKEAYAIIACLFHWHGWIGTTPVDVVTDHKSLEAWTTEYVQTPSGPTGRRARWHEILSQFNLTVRYMPGDSNTVADALSRWAYPANTDREDVCAHGSADSARQFKAEEALDEMTIPTLDPAPADEADPASALPLPTSVDDSPWGDESYRLDPGMRDLALAHLGIPHDSVRVDLFSDISNAQEDHFITKDMDAFSFDWGLLCSAPHTTLWANPPFSLLSKVLAKVAVDGCRMVLCAPVWEHRPWWKLLEQMSLGCVLLPPQSWLYSEGWTPEGKFLPPPAWRSALFLLDSRLCGTIVPSLDHAWVVDRNRKKGWPELLRDMPDAASVLVALRSGKVITPSDADETASTASEDSGGVEDEEDIPCSFPKSDGSSPAPPNLHDGPGTAAEPALGATESSDPQPALRFRFFNDLSPAEQLARRQATGHRRPYTRTLGSAAAPPMAPAGRGAAHTLLAPKEWVMSRDWTVDYPACPHWSELWSEAMTPNPAWPDGVQIAHGKLYLNGKLCVPTSLVADVLRDFHECNGHIGKHRMLKVLGHHFYFPDSSVLPSLVHEMKKTCLTCQATERPYWRIKGPIDHHPIPERFMTSVSIDIFSMPEVTWSGVSYDCLVLCIDRLSGWIVARPALKNGLTAKATAHLLLDAGWNIFGIPTTITSDQGPQFTGQWWRTLCARLGVRQAFSQAHRPQANGKAERAGQQVIELLKKLNGDEDINWVEALPRVLSQIHDMVGEAGLSPYQIVFGRERVGLGIPYRPERSCEDAENFLDRMSHIDGRVSYLLTRRHDARAAHLNSANKARTPFSPGDQVWLMKAKSLASSSKLEGRWAGPMDVLRRTSKSCYELRDHLGHLHPAHLDQMKPFIPDRPLTPGEPLTYVRHNADRTPAPAIGSILKHRPSDSETWEFLTHWGGTDPSEATWESPSAFLRRRLLPQLWDYCQLHHLVLSIPDLLVQPSAIDLAPH